MNVRNYISHLMFASSHHNAVSLAHTHTITEIVLNICNQREYFDTYTVWARAFFCLFFSRLLLVHEGGIKRCNRVASSKGFLICLFDCLLFKLRCAFLFRFSFRFRFSILFALFFSSIKF